MPASSIMKKLQRAKERRKRNILIFYTIRLTRLCRKSWLAHIRELAGEISNLEDGEEYALYFLVSEMKTDDHMAMANMILGLLIAKNPGKKSGV